MQLEQEDSGMILFRRSVKTKCKIALAVFILAVLVVFVWYYLQTGHNPMIEVKNRLGSVVAKYYDKGRDDKSFENQTAPMTSNATANALSEVKQTTHFFETHTEEKADVSDDKHRLSSSKEDTMKGKASEHEQGHLGLITSKPNIQRMNALISSDAIEYREGVLQNARKTFFREARPSDPEKEKCTVFFLHGIGLTSIIWINIGTFQILAELGYRALAVDLPGHGNSNDLSIPYSRDDILGYMTNLFTALDLHLPVLVSPSKGGEYAMPLVMAYPHILCGLVAIAPSDTSHYLIKDYQKLSVPMLVLFGEKDQTMLHTSSLDSLWYVPNRKIYMIKNTTHACYVDHPPTFHKLLLEFLNGLQ